MKLEPRTKTLHEFSDAALSHSQFGYKDNFKVKDVDEEQYLVKTKHRTFQNKQLNIKNKDIA